ncbi:MAG: sulfur carrier protein ThiS [Akkermansiaceae bacterium]
MNITLNGKKHPLSASTSVEALLSSLGLNGKPVIVEYNKEALFPRDYATVILNDNDQLEIITIAAGG